MKHVNGDMEDLFRRASEKYPLRTDSADWDRLAAALDKDPGPPSDTDKDEKRRRRGIFWWWLLLPLAVGAGIYSWHAGRTGVTSQEAATNQEAAMQRAKTQEAATQGAGTQGAKTQTGVQPGGSSTGAARPLTSTARGGRTGSTATGGAATGRTGSTATGVTRPTGSPAERTQLTGSVAEAGGISEGNEAGSTGRNMTSENAPDRKPEGNIPGKNAVGKKGEYSAAGGAAPARPDWRRAQTAGSFSLVVDVKAPAARKDSGTKQAKKATAKSNGGHGYIGLTGAPDFSTVKMQAMKGVGATWGVLLGYAFNSHWAVESGIYLDRKKYYTAGEYFKGEVMPPYNSTLQSVNGTCNMWEIPLNVRYNFNPGSKITWFATAGASSYFMTKQQYTYQFEGGLWPSSTNWSTSVPANYLFSIINISGGFEQRIGKIGNLRIEPYVRLPLSGIGTGRLAIMSAGLNVGITRRLW